MIQMTTADPGRVIGKIGEIAQTYNTAAQQLSEPVARQPLIVTEEHVTVYVSVGNSDDKLGQAQWSTFCQVVDNRVRRYAEAVHGYWHSLSNAPWQNACWCFEVRQSEAKKLKGRLQDACTDFGQDSIAWAIASTEFIRPVV